MPSIYQQALGSDFDKLHPRIQRRFGFASGDGAQRLYEGLLGFSFPLCLSGVADVCEWYDDDEETFRVEVSVANRTCGGLFGYRGRFNAVWKKTMPGEMPADLRPLREERRE